MSSGCESRSRHCQSGFVRRGVAAKSGRQDREDAETDCGWPDSAVAVTPTVPRCWAGDGATHGGFFDVVRIPQDW